MVRASRKRQSKRRFGPGRNQLLDAQARRGRGPYNLWIRYSPRNRCDVVLKSDPEDEHFCWVEGDESVAAYELEPAPVSVVINGRLHTTQFDARVELRTGVIELREVKPSNADLDAREQVQLATQSHVAAMLGFRYVRVTRDTLDEHRQLIANWRCGLAFLTACRSLVLDPQVEEFVQRLGAARRPLSLEQLLLGVDPIEQPARIAALLQGLQSGRLRSNLDGNPLCASTVFALREAPND